jgi:hypothetical protein
MRLRRLVEIIPQQRRAFGQLARFFAQWRTGWRTS